VAPPFLIDSDIFSFLLFPYFKKSNQAKDALEVVPYTPLPSILVFLPI
jgi:hypothetical protein